MTPGEIAERVRARLFRRRDAYRAVFGAPLSSVVLTDLARYCHARRSSLTVSRVTGTVDPIALAFAEGRRDVFNRIVSQLHLSADQIDRIAYSKENDQ